MALSGIFYGTSSNPRIKPQIRWSAVQSVEGNYSDVTATLAYTRSNSGYTTGGTWKGTLSIDGDSKTKTLYMEIVYGEETAVITHTARIYHDDDGQKRIVLSATGGIVTPAEASLKTTEISGEITLDTIPRATEISATDCNVTACSTLVLDKKSQAFQHSIAYRFGALTGYVSSTGQPVEQAELFSQTVVNFRVPEAFYYELPDSPTGICTLTCYTYNGETQVGSRETTFTVTAGESLCAPEAVLTYWDGNGITADYTGDNQVLVLGASKGVFALSATGKYGAEIVEKTVLGQSFTQDTLELDPVTTQKISYSVTDSRGYRRADTLEVPYVPYVPLQLHATVSRVSPTADQAVVTITGQFYRGSFGAVENQLYLEVSTEYETLTPEPTQWEGNRFQVQVELQKLAYDQSHIITVYGDDLLGVAEKTLTLSPAVPVFDWGAEDFRFHVPVYVPELYVNGKKIE